MTPPGYTVASGCVDGSSLQPQEMPTGSSVRIMDKGRRGLKQIQGRDPGWEAVSRTRGSTTARSQMDSSRQPGAEVTATAVAPFACGPQELLYVLA